MSTDGGRPAPGRRVLIVEDRYLVADDLRRVCERLGVAVAGVVPDVESGLRIASTERLDLAILDIDLRGRDVFGVAAALEERDVPFIFVTGYRAAVLPERFRSRPLVRKPFTEAEVVARIRTLLAPG